MLPPISDAEAREALKKAHLGFRSLVTTRSESD